jgi:hypothetical protein
MDGEVEWTSEAWTELRALRVADRGPLMRAAARLARQAERETRTRAPLRGAPPGLTRQPIWEARIAGGHRLLYGPVGPSRDTDRRCAQILRVLIGAGRGPTALTRAEAREIERRRKTLRKLGGGIPHEVVRRAWLTELARANS